MSYKTFTSYAVGISVLAFPFAFGAFSRMAAWLYPECAQISAGRSPCDFFNSLIPIGWTLMHMVGAVLALGSLIVAVTALFHLRTYLKEGVNWKPVTLVSVCLVSALLLAGYGVYLQYTFRL